MVKDDDSPPSPEEAAEAAALAKALEGAGTRSPLPSSVTDDLATAMAISAAAGRQAPLGDVQARGLARAAVVAATRRRAIEPQRRRWFWATGLVAVAAAILLLVRFGLRPELPARLCSRSAGMLVPGPFPSTQSAADRLDMVAADRLVAWRELRFGSGEPR